MGVQPVGKQVFSDGFEKATVRFVQKWAIVTMPLL